MTEHEPSRTQQSLVDQASLVVATALRTKHCRHERRCTCYGRYRLKSWLILDALIHVGWTITPPEENTHARA